MQKIIIDEEFKVLLPELDKDTYGMLEENLLQNGCRDSIVLWGNILIDGHNRYEICTKHDIPFNTINRTFKSREEALIFIINTQVSRRNLLPIQISYFRGLHYITDKRMHGGDKKSKRQNDVLIEERVGSTSKRLAAQYRVSPRTIDRDAKAAAAIEAIGEVSLPAKKRILSGEVSLDKVKLRELSESPGKELKAVATAIENGTYEKKPPVSTTSSGTSGHGTSNATITAEISHIQITIDDLLRSFTTLFKTGSKTEKAELKTVLRSCMDRFEDLYRKNS